MKTLSKWRHYVWCISLLLCAATMVLWVRSYWTWDIFTLAGPRLQTDDRSIDPPKPETVTTTLMISFWPGKMHLGYGREVMTSSPLDLFLRQPGLHHVSTNAEYTHGVVEEPWHVRPKNFLGFSFKREDIRGSGAFGSEIDLVIPMWTSLSLLVLPLLFAVRCVRARRAAASGICPICRYNLTGNTSGVCPECGIVVAGKAGAAA